MEERRNEGRRKKRLMCVYYKKKTKLYIYIIYIDIFMSVSVCSYYLVVFKEFLNIEASL